MLRAINLIGLTFGRLTVISRLPSVGGATMWRCRCECGEMRSVVGKNMRNGVTRSCGCLKSEISRQRAVARNTTHGWAPHHDRTGEYRAWVGARNRCLDPNNASWKHYGGRGITICDRWRHSFEHFISDMGKRPSNRHSLDRIDNDGPYAPENCRWATLAQQANNRSNNNRLEVDGHVMTLSEAATKYGVAASTIAARRHLGWPMAMALLLPVGKHTRHYS